MEPDAGSNTVREVPEGSVVRYVVDGFAEASVAEDWKTVAPARRLTFSTYSDWSKPLLNPYASSEAAAEIARPPEVGPVRRRAVERWRVLLVVEERPLPIVI